MVRRTLGLERLERRVLLAGDVLVSVTGGDLILKGDVEANQIEVTQMGQGTFKVTGLNGTTVSTKTQPPGTDVTVQGVTDDVSIDLGKGDDQLFLAERQHPGRPDGRDESRK